MDLTNFWFPSGTNQSGGGGGGNDPGDPIGQSLRFRRPSYLQGQPLTSSLVDQTWSIWFKRGSNIGGTGDFIVGDHNSGYGFGFWSTPDALANNAGSTASTAFYRDPSAWYHLVIAGNPTTAQQWINGELIPGLDNLLHPYWTTGFNLVVGHLHPPSGTQYAFDGYMADIHFIDGQVLDPTTFGRFNTNGVWVPVDPSLTNSAHVSNTGTGTNFSQDNIFTPFVPDTNHFYYVIGGDLIIDFPDGNAGVTNIKFNGGGNTAGVNWELFVNGSSVGTGTTQNGYVTQHSIDIASTDVTQIRLTSLGGTGDVGMGGLVFNDVQVTRTNDYGANGFRLDFRDPDDIGKDYSGNGNDFSPTGFELADTSNPTYDLMQDSPTQNFATFNPLVPTTTTETDANLTTTAQSWWNAVPTIKLPESGKFYWEKNTGTFSASTVYGLRKTISLSSAQQYADFFNPGVGIQHDGNGYINGVYTTGLGPNATSATDAFQFAYDADSGKYWVALNGVWFNGGDPAAGTGEGATVDPGSYFIVEGNFGASSTHINFGQQQPFAYTPPAGFEALQTAKMPAAPIANGRDHFQAITGPGANILTAAQSAFPNGLWWIKDRVNATQHQLVDSVRGATQAVNLPSSGNGEVAYSAPTGDSVAWCWSVDGPASANNDGSIETQVAVNSDAGFSIITYTGDGGAASTIGHGLGAVPEFYAVWVRTTGQSQLATARHKDLTDANKVLYLTSNSGEANYAVFGGVLPTDSVITVQGNLANNTNGNGLDFVMYAWTSVPGYSAFGSYTGNSSADGPFVYLGFKPAFILIKSTSTANWMIFDSTRGPFNPNNAALYANQTTAEYSGTGYPVDFLSNGFKVRVNDAALNQNNLIYAAFAENPFQSPVTAR